MKLDPKALEAAGDEIRDNVFRIDTPASEIAKYAIQAYCEAAGVVMASTHVLETAANCINDLASDGAWGWAHEEVADELRAMVAAAQEGK